jgi:hypothetical protein
MPGEDHFGSMAIGPLDPELVEFRGGAAKPETLARMERLRSDLPFVIAHERGHTVQEIAMGETVSPTRVPGAAYVEHKVAHEAVADLFGAGFSRSRGSVRDIGTHLPGLGSLDAFRSAVLTATPGFVDSSTFDVHRGTQLITAPALHIAQHDGWDALGTTAGAAVHLIGDDIRSGRRHLMDIPSTAEALLGGAERTGISHAIRTDMADDWRRLGVLVQRVR